MEKNDVEMNQFFSILSAKTNMSQKRPFLRLAISYLSQTASLITPFSDWIFLHSSFLKISL